MQPTTTLTPTPTMATAPKALQVPMTDLANAARVATQEIRGLGSALSLPALTTVMAPGASHGGTHIMTRDELLFDIDCRIQSGRYNITNVCELVSGYAAQDTIRHYVHDTIANFACNMIMQDRKDHALIINGHLTGHINDSLNRLDAQVTIIDSRTQALTRSLSTM